MGQNRNISTGKTSPQKNVLTGPSILAIEVNAFCFVFDFKTKMYTLAYVIN